MPLALSAGKGDGEGPPRRLNPALLNRASRQTGDRLPYLLYCSGRACLKTTTSSLMGWTMRDCLMKPASLMK